MARASLGAYYKWTWDNSGHVKYGECSDIF